MGQSRGAPAAIQSEMVMISSGASGAAARVRSSEPIMSLVHSARLNGHDLYAYRRAILERRPVQPAARIGALLPQRRAP